MISVESCEHQSTWDDYILDHGGHPLQLWGWGHTKVAHGWSADRVFVSEEDDIIGAAQLLIKVLPGGIKTIGYIPRGPVTSKKNRAVVLDALADYAKKHYKAIVITIEPHWLEFDPPQGWQHSANTILHPHTLILDLNKSTDDLRAVMTKKTRQYIRKSSSEELLISATWPQPLQYDDLAAGEFDRLKTLVVEARYVTASLPGNQKYTLLYQNDSLIADNSELIAHLARVSSVEPAEEARGLRLAASGREAWLDVDADTLYEHQTNLEVRLAETRQFVETLEKRLSNTSYTEKAPAHLVEESQKQLAEKKLLVEQLARELEILG